MQGNSVGDKMGESFVTRLMDESVAAVKNNTPMPVWPASFAVNQADIRKQVQDKREKERQKKLAIMKSTDSKKVLLRTGTGPLTDYPAKALTPERLGSAD